MPVKAANDLTFEDIVKGAQRVVDSCADVATSPEQTLIKDVEFDGAADAAEELVIMLLRFYRNERMISLALDEIAEAVREGY